MSQFCTKHFPKILEEQIQQSAAYNSIKSPPLEEVIFLSVEKLVQKLKKTDIDLLFSGTTCNLCFIKQDLLYVTNIGDSRSVIGYKEESKGIE